MNFKKFNITLIQPFGYTHSLALLEAAEFFEHQIRSLGFEVSLKKNRFEQNAVNIILGAHLITDGNNLPKNTIIFNSEQTSEKNDWFKNKIYLDILKNNYTWEYSKSNQEKINNTNSSIIYFGYESQLKRLKTSHQKEYDLLFYGSMNPEKEKTLKKLSDRGLKVKNIFNLYSAERDNHLEKTRAVLNLHHYKTAVFQQIRAFYPLINEVPVFSEDFAPETAPEFYQDSIFKPNGEDFVEYVVRKLKSADFEQESQKLIEHFKKHSTNNGIKDALDAAITHFQKNNNSDESQYVTPKKINLGSGKDYQVGCLNIDIRESVHPDLLLDISKIGTLPYQTKDNHGNNIELKANYFQEIIANDVLEHVPDLESLMTQCLNLLEVGGEMKVNVPYDLSHGAWQDPTHIRGFNENSFLYYTTWFWYLNWFDYRFEVSRMQFNPSELGKQMKQSNVADSVIVRTPRAVDSIYVVLRKIETTLEERTQARAFTPRLSH